MEAGHMRTRWLLSFVWIVAAGAYGAESDTGKHDEASAKAPIALRTAPDYRAIVERYGSAVVGVTVAGIKQDSPANGRLPLDRGTLPQSPESPDSPQGPLLDLGSGSIIRSDGLVLTNAHVVEGAESLIVTLGDRREFAAKVVGVDEETDVAVIKISGDGFPMVKLGNSD